MEYVFWGRPWTWTHRFAVGTRETNIDTFINAVAPRFAKRRIICGGDPDPVPGLVFLLI